MTDLAARQQAFLAAILDEAAPLPDGWGNRQALGMSVYRGNYRSALMGALSDIFERTARYVGERAFRQASMHHVITRPPSGWTIDDVGEGFDQTCAQLFAQNPEVTELAWLEWRMRELATAPDAEVLTPQAFAEASAGFGEEQWASLRLTFQPRSAARVVAHDLDGLWRALGEERALPDPLLPQPMTCLTWREGHRPTFLMVEEDHAAAFAAMAGGAQYGELIALLLGEGTEPTPEAIQQAAMRAGAMLGQWLGEGLVTGFEA